MIGCANGQLTVKISLPSPFLRELSALQGQTMTGPDIHDLYERLWYAVQKEQIELEFDLKLLNKPGSPVFSARDAVLPWAATFLLGIVGWRLGGWIGSVVAILAMLILTATTINYSVMKRLRERAEAHALAGYLSFEELWNAGAVSLRMVGSESSEFKGPNLQWTTFAEGLPKTEAEKSEDRTGRKK